ncbi:Uncharacterised protein [Mycobacteroides abscessus subsp. bolletii]|nr:Uncharacterised protein [Mycobacteroides abscessus subsp. bolletii]
MPAISRFNRSWNRLLTLGASLTVLTLVMSSCSTNETLPPQAESRVIFAYSSTTTVGLASEAKVIARIEGNFTAPRSTMFTSDGKYVAALSIDPGNTSSLKVIEVASGKSRSIPAYFDRFSAGPDSLVVWLESPNRLMGLNLAEDQPQPRLLRAIDLPPISGEGATAAPQLVAADRGTALLSRWEDRTSRPGPQNLYLASPNGSVKPLGRIKSNSPIGYAYYSPNGKMIAYANDSEFCENTTVSIVDIQNSTIQTIAPPNRPEPARLVVRSIWWQPDGTLSATFKGLPCREQKADTEAMPDTAYNLINGSWSEISDRQVTQILVFGKDKAASIASNNGNGGELTLDLSGKQTTIANKAQRIITEPARD